MKRMAKDSIKKHAPHWADDVSTDPEAFREALMRRIYDFLGTWRTCRMPLCRRHRSCVNRDVACAQDLPAASERGWARARIKLFRALEARKAEAERNAESSAAGQPEAGVTRSRSVCRGRR